MSHTDLGVSFSEIGRQFGVVRINCTLPSSVPTGKASLPSSWRASGGDGLELPVRVSAGRHA